MWVSIVSDTCPFGGLDAWKRGHCIPRRMMLNGRPCTRNPSSFLLDGTACRFKDISHGMRSDNVLLERRKRWMCRCRSLAPEESSSATPLECSRKLARVRSLESSGSWGNPLVVDPYAEYMVENFEEFNDGTPPMTYEDASYLMSTRFLDDELIVASGMVNVNRGQDYNQVVLIGDGMCTRFYRLPWPAGMVVYLVAPGEVHERAEAILAERKVKGPPGCLLRRVDCSFKVDGGFSNALLAAGFRPDRLSIWALQGISCLHFDKETLNTIFTDIANLAALESIILGELPVGSTEKDVDDTISSFCFLGRSFASREIPHKLGITDFEDRSQAQGNSRWNILNTQDSAIESRVFRSHQRRLSLEEMNIYQAHVADAEDIGEDFFGNFS